MDNQKELDSQLNGLIDEISIREHAERCEIFQDVAKDLLLFSLTKQLETKSVFDCMNDAIDMAWEFSGRVLEKMRKEYNAKQDV